VHRREEDGEEDVDEVDEEDGVDEDEPGKWANGSGEGGGVNMAL
jgi:hypothetical protein